MIKNTKGNILLTFILLIGVSALAFSILYLVTGRVRGSFADFNRTSAFYVAEAGVNKAIWNLVTPSGLGGHGSAWRTAGQTEAFNSGQFTFSITDGMSGAIVIISTGEVGGIARTIQQIISASDLPAAFNYALYSNGSLELKGSTVVKGDIFANGNITVQRDANHPVGDEYTSAGKTVNGEPGTVPDPMPTMPSLNTTYYDTKISEAAVQPAGDLNMGAVDLAGSTTLVNGDITITGPITGSGIIVATGKINVEGATISPGVTLISQDEMTIKASANIQANCILYSAEKIAIPGNSRISGSLLSANVTTASGTPTIHGIIYSWAISANLTGTVNIYGSVVNPATSSYRGDITIEFDPSYLPPAPPGLSSGGFSMIKGTWKEL